MIHGSIDNCNYEGLLVNFDIASMYPALMIEYNYLSRNVYDKTKYRQIRDTRLELKKNKDPNQAPYKIVLNSTFGASKDKYNELFDPLQANNTCIGGQMIMLDLLEKLEDALGVYYKPININTDGILGWCYNQKTYDRLIEVCDEWSKRTKMELEFDIYTKIIQKDVNNYIIVDKDGKTKSKGSYVKKLHKLDNDLPIINKAIKEYFVNGVPVRETILKATDLIDFQKVSKVGATYKYCLHGTEIIKEKCNRVFASRNKTDGGLYKVKTTTAEKIANTPLHCFIDNGNILGKKVPYKLDREWYINLALERIKQFKGE